MGLDVQSALLWRLQPAHHHRGDQAEKQPDTGDHVMRLHGKQTNGRIPFEQSDRSARGGSAKEQKRQHGCDFDCEHKLTPFATDLAISHVYRMLSAIF